MSEKSLTSTDSFRQRIQRSEVRRTFLIACVLASILLSTILRRILGGAIMREDAVFYPFIAILILGAAYEIVLLFLIRRSNRKQELLPDRVWIASGAVDLAIPGVLLALQAWLSPTGAIASLTAPSLLLFPVAILLSVLRLRPRFTITLGIGAAVIHWGLTLWALVATQSPPELYPTMLTYGFAFLALAAAAMVVTRDMREHVIHAAQEAAARQAAQRDRDRLSRDLEIAHDIQHSLLPKAPPSITGFNVAGWNKAADQTGGDYFDWQVLPNGHVVFVIADATGHGIGPALLIAVCRAYFRASSRTPFSVEAALTQVNTLLMEDMPAGKFITAAVFVLDPAVGTGKLYSAGHAPLFFYSAESKSVQSWDADEMPLGIDPAFGSVTSRDVAFKPGDSLVLMTDGFFEWPNHQEELFGIERLEQSIVRHAAARPETMIQNIREEVQTFAAGSVQRDDLTALIIQRN